MDVDACRMTGRVDLWRERQRHETRRCIARRSRTMSAEKQDQRARNDDDMGRDTAENWHGT
jgi:hypothetical protein